MILVVLAALAGAVLLPAGVALAQALEEDPPTEDPGTGVSGSDPVPAAETVADDGPPPDATSVPEPTPTTTEPALTEPALTESAPTESAPTESAPTEPAPVVETAPEPAPEPTPVLVVELIPEPVVAPEPVAEPVLVIDPTPTVEASPVPSPLDPVPVPEPAAVPPTAEQVPVADPVLETAPLPVSLAASEPAPIAVPSPTPVSAAQTAHAPLAAKSVPAAAPPDPPQTPPTGPPMAPPTGGQSVAILALEEAALPVATIPDAADPPENVGTKAAVPLKVEAASVPGSLADGLLELAGSMFDTASAEAVRLTLRSEEVATGLIRDAAGEETPVAPAPDVPAPATPPATPPAPAPAPAGGFSCGLSFGTGNCGNDLYAVLLLGVLAGAFALGISRGSSWTFEEILKPKSLLLQVAERPG